MKYKVIRKDHYPYHVFNVGDIVTKIEGSHAIYTNGIYLQFISDNVLKLK